MLDPLTFGKTVLRNGITVYSKPWDVPYVTFQIFFPVGHMHNTGEIDPGSAHLLEHLVCRRSRAFPITYSFKKHISLSGGHFGASTSTGHTRYELRCEDAVFLEALGSLLEHIDSTVINDTDLRDEGRIIKNERKRSERFYPGRDKLDQYCATKWMRTTEVTLRQILGDDSDLDTASIASLQALRLKYCDPRTFVFVGGNFDLDAVCKALEQLTTTPHSLPSHVEAAGWCNRHYHEAQCSESPRFTYHLGGISPTSTVETVAANSFLGLLLVNHVHGTLYEWLRTELGLVYELGYLTSIRPVTGSISWELWAPMSGREDVVRVRAELHDRIQASIEDGAHIALELKRRIGQSVLNAGSLDNIMSDGVGSVLRYGRVITMTEQNELLQSVASSAHLRTVYEERWAPEHTGEFLAMPVE